jgi:hypothetical protein
MESDGLVQVWERWMIYQSDRGGCFVKSEFLRVPGEAIVAGLCTQNGRLTICFPQGECNKRRTRAKAEGTNNQCAATVIPCLGGRQSMRIMLQRGG